MSRRSFAHSVPSATEISALVTAAYEVDPIVECRFIHRGFNDSYEVKTGTGERYVFRLSLSRHRLRGAADVSAETAFLAYLDSEEVPVSTAVLAKDGALFTTVALPDGCRPAVLFRYIEGRAPDPDEPQDARIQGIALARLHRAADNYSGREDGRHRLDLDHLLHRPVEAVVSLDLGASQARHDLTALQSRLAHAVEGLGRDLSWTRCHGDVHGGNARIAAAGKRAGQAVFFDFDDSGFGYLAYDLAVHLWAQVSFGRRRHPMWRAFDIGYRSIRPVEPADEAALPVFVAIRHLWLMGEWASGTPRFGTESMPVSMIENQIDFLLAWERANLVHRLL